MIGSGRIAGRLAAAACALSACATAPPAAEPCSMQARLRYGGAMLEHGASRLWYRVAGPPDAPALMYLHGGPGSTSLTFERSAGPHLERRFRVVYVDQPGCGRSGGATAPAAPSMAHTVTSLEALLDHLGIERAHLVAHSFGGVVAVELAHAAPARVASIVFVDTTDRIGDALRHQVSTVARLAPRAFPEAAPDLVATATGSLGAFEALSAQYQRLGRQPLQRALHFADPDAQARMEAIEAEARDALCTGPAVVAAYQAAGYFAEGRAVTPPLPEIPAVIIAGEQSEVIGRPQIEGAARAWRADVVWLPAGHFPWFEAPRAFTDAVAAFVDGHAPRE